jgi:hypothetical protein
MAGPIDYAFALLFAVVVELVEYAVFWPRLRDAMERGVPNARRDTYRRVLAGQWACAGLLIARWVTTHRTWSDLRLTVPADWRTIAGAAIVVLVAGFFAFQAIVVHRLPPAKRAAIAPRIGAVAVLLPRTRAELGWFSALSVTAGIVEELLYRGFLLWLLQPSMGIAAAAAVSVAVFGLGHAYQGRSGALRATAAGAVMTGIVLLTGSLIPAMIVHAIIDLGGGNVGYAVLGENARGRVAAESAG